MRQGKRRRKPILEYVIVKATSTETRLTKHPELERRVIIRRYCRISKTIDTTEALHAHRLSLLKASKGQNSVHPEN